MSRYAHAVYCDDIRQEVGGKITVIGIYSGQVLVPMVPCNLPKLCLYLNVSATKESPIENLNVTGVFAGNEVINMVLDKDQINQIMSATGDMPGAKRMVLSLMGVMAPFIVPVPGKLSLTVVADGEEIYCDSLNISVAPPDTVFGF